MVIREVATFLAHNLNLACSPFCESLFEDLTKDNIFKLDPSNSELLNIEWSIILNDFIQLFVFSCFSSMTILWWSRVLLQTGYAVFATVLIRAQERNNYIVWILLSAMLGVFKTLYKNINCYDLWTKNKWKISGLNN